MHKVSSASYNRTSLNANLHQSTSWKPSKKSSRNSWNCYTDCLNPFLNQYFWIDWFLKLRTWKRWWK